MPDSDFSADLERYLEGLTTLSYRGAGFLARGEYSLNYLVRGKPDLVAWLVTGTQVGLPPEEQASYEHHALELLAPSGVTPKPYLADPNPEGLPYPLILEEYLPGRPLHYSADLVFDGRLQMYGEPQAFYDHPATREVALTIRPEAVRLEDGENSFTSRVTSAAYLGTQVHYELRTTGTTLRAALPPHVRLAVGEEVTARLPAGSLWVLGGEPVS